jgi:hypothetical protein
VVVVVDVDVVVVVEVVVVEVEVVEVGVEVGVLVVVGRGGAGRRLRRRLAGGRCRSSRRRAVACRFGGQSGRAGLARARSQQQHRRADQGPHPPVTHRSDRIAHRADRAGHPE